MVDSLTHQLTKRIMNITIVNLVRLNLTTCTLISFFFQLPPWKGGQGEGGRLKKAITVKDPRLDGTQRRSTGEYMTSKFSMWFPC